MGLCLLASVACAEPEVFGFGEFGRPINLVDDESALPRLITQTRLDTCGAPAGACTSLCVDTEPANCPEDACMAVAIDSGSPFTVMPSEGYGLGTECLGVRQGHSVLDNMVSLALTVTRFRFEPVPVLRAPSDKAGPWEWDLGTAPALADQNSRRVPVGAVIGGNLLRHFAVRLTDAEGPPTVTFYKQFPGTEKGLADLGFAFIRLQYPGRLLGTRVNDRCAFGEGVACDLDQLQISSFQGDTDFEATRMMLDACIAAPPCAPLWEVEDGTGRRACELRPGRAATLADAARRCDAADDDENGGRGASFIVATAVDGLVLFEDSAVRMFGELGALPPCEGGDALPATARACVLDEATDLHVTGYGRVQGLRRIRVRSLALMAGSDQPSAVGPCTRLRRRLAASELQCRGLDDFDRPHAPDPTNESRRDDHAVILGESHWGFGQDVPNTATWLVATVLPADATITMNIRREAGTDAVQPDGLLGSALLNNTDVVLDYTETQEAIGVRVACTSRNSRGCLPLPLCSPTSERAGETEPGRESCCWGMPANLVEDALTRPGNEADACCETLTADALERVQNFGACIGVVPPAGIGGITP